MKKRMIRKLALNKETIASLNYTEMNESRGGARPSRIGTSCYTGVCCYSKKVCEGIYNENDNNDDQ